jgi:tyrosine-protein kinase Etk/Wzc
MPTVNEILQEPPAVRSQSPPREFDIFDVILILAVRKWTIFLTSAAGFIIGVAWVLTVPPSFTAKAVILPPQQDNTSTSALFGQFGALASMSGLGGSLGIKNPSDLYIGLLQSDSVTDAMIKRFDIVRRLHPKRFSDAQMVVQRSAKFVVGKDGMISIEVTDNDKDRAAAMANAYVDELYKLNNHLALGGAAQKRLFFEQQLAQEKDHLADAEVALKQTQESTGIIAPGGQTETIIREVAQMRAEITSREVQLASLRTSSTDQNPDVVRITSELNGLHQQMHDLETATGKRAPGDISLSTANVPQAGLEYIRKEREVKYHQFLFDLLARQYEAARIDEAKAAPVIQVVDPAYPPDRKSAPFRALWGIVGCALGFFFSIGWVLASYVYRRIQADEEQGRRLALLRQELKLRR